MKRKSIFILLSFVSFLSFGASTLEISPEHQTICTSGKDTAKFTLKANAFPTNSDIVIYKNTNNNFNPYNNEGEEIGRIKIKGGSTDFLSNSCPTILGIFIDACNAAPLIEQDNEYMIITSGNGFKVNDLGVDLPNSTNGANQDINLGSNPCKFSNTFDAAYLNTLRTGFCNASNLNFAKPGDDIPAGAIVIIFTGNGTSFPYNFSGFCQLGVPVYILQNNCFRSSGAFVNNNNNDACNLTTSNRYRLSRIINKSCIDTLTYDVCGLPIYTPATANDGDGNYVIRQKNKADTASIANNGIQNNAADKCNGVVADSLITNYTFNYPIASALCNDTIYVKAVGEPVALTGQVSSNEVSFYMACVDISTPKDRYEICSGATSNINISTSDPNATISWVVSGGNNTSGQTAGIGNLIAQTLTLLNNAISDSVVYTITASDNNCTKIKNVKVVINAAPQAFTLGKDSVHCTSVNQVLNAGAGASWTLNGQSIANNQITYTATQEGTYKATISNQCGTVSDEIILTQENVSVQISATATEICNNTIDLTVQGQYDSIRWSNNVTANLTTIIQEGSYSVVVYRNGCSAKASINITKCQTTTCNPTITGNLEFCQGGNTTLDAGAGFLTYVWSTGEQTQIIQVAQGGNYSVNVTGNNCTGKASVEVKTLNAPQAFTFGNDTTYCGNFSQVLNASAAASWTLNGQSIANNQTTYTATQVGKYEATVSNQCGTEKASINISQNQLPAVNLGADVLFCDDPVTLTAQTDANNSVVWNTQESTHTITVSTAGIYSVQVTDANNCSNSDTVNVDLNCKNEVWVPNAFTPNGDGTNDIFYVRGNPKNTMVEDMQIVDRWGNIVFKAKNVLPEDKTKGWDGMYKGKKQQLDVYGYYIKVKYKDGQTGILKGSLMLVE